MKKVIALLIIGMFILSGIATANLLRQDEKIKIKAETISFSATPSFSNHESYITVDVSEATTYLNEPGKPRLPIYRTVFELPKNAHIKGVDVTHTTPETFTITEKIIPNAKPKPMNVQTWLPSSEELVEDEIVYQSDAVYPASWYDYTIKCGLNNQGEATTFVCVDVYPVRYQPFSNTIHRIDDADLTLRYYEEETPIQPQMTDTYNLVIIVPEVFADMINPLVTHKENIGWSTKVKTVEEILSEYSGRDEPEQIKYFIKDAKENWDTTHVLLLGGLKSYIYAKDREDRNHGSTNGWHVPVRYTNVRHSNEVGVVSDLYYSDLYRYNEDTSEWEFEDWDSNGDGIFAARGFTEQDELDLIPDLYVGRLAIRMEHEIETQTNKIIGYESSSPADKPWYDRMVGVGGRTFSLFDGLDQYQRNLSGQVLLNQIQWQEFIPRSDILSRVELRVNVEEPLPESNLIVRLEQPLGTVIATSELPVSQIPTNQLEWTSFDFQNTVVTPEEPYYLTVSCEQGANYFWSYSNPLVPGRSRYTRGNSSLGTDKDWCFQTYDLEEGGDQPDGEYSVDTAFRYMESIIDEEVRIYWSNEGTNDPIPETEDIMNEFNQGAGFIIMEGHGNPLSWATHPVPDGSPFQGGMSLTDMPDFTNGDRLPIVIVGGCHNALFNVSLLRTLIGRSHENWYWTNGLITPMCFCWALVASPNGGAIASTGCTGLGLGGGPPDIESSGGLDCNFFYQVGNGATTLGEAHSGAIQKYVLENSLSTDEIFCIVEFHLFGDPSLQFGGVS